MIRRAVLPALVIVVAVAGFLAVGCSRTQDPAAKAEVSCPRASTSGDVACAAAPADAQGACQHADSVSCASACKAHTRAECTCGDAVKATCACPHTEEAGDAVTSAQPCPGAQGSSCARICPKAQKAAPAKPQQGSSS